MTERMLIRHLHELVEDGIISRVQEKTMPPCGRDPMPVHFRGEKARA